MDHRLEFRHRQPAERARAHLAAQQRLGLRPDAASRTTFDHYQVQLATDAAFTTILVDQPVATLSPSEYTLTANLSVSTKYYWRVRAFNTDGDYSAWSTVWSFRTSATAAFDGIVGILVFGLVWGAWKYAVG